MINRTWLGLVFILTLAVPVFAAGSFYGGVTGSATFTKYQVDPDLRGYYSGAQIQDYWPILQERDSCEARQDLLVQVAPLGCQPSVVRSDLLAEQNVPVFCQLDALRLNPLIDIKQLRSISFTGKYPSSVVGVGFHPAQAALRTSSELLGSPSLNNVGYAVVVLKKQANESSLPDFINFTLQAKMDYYAGNTLGIGTSSFLLQKTSDEEWKSLRNKQSFLQGKFFVRLEDATADTARFSLYGGDVKLGSATVKRGATSAPIYLPGSYCEGRVQIAFDGYQTAQKVVRLQVDDDILELYEGASFLNGKCRIDKVVSELNLTNRIELSCGSERFTLRLSAREFKAGDEVYLTNGSESVNNGTVWIVQEPVRQGNVITGYKILQGTKSRTANIGELRSVSGEVLNEAHYDQTTEAYFKNAVTAYRQVANDYSLEKPRGAQELEVRTFGEQALERAISLAERLGKQKSAVELINTYLTTYPSSTNSSYFQSRLDREYQYDSTNAIAVVNIDNGLKTIRLLDTEEPSKRSRASFTLGSGQPFEISLYDTKEVKGVGNFTLTRVDADRVDVNALCFTPQGTRTGSSTVSLILGSTTGTSGSDARAKEVCNGKVLRLEDIESEQYVRARVLPVSATPNSVVNFSIGVGIEKRAIKLTPERTKERISELNKTIEKWDRLSTNLGNVVKTMKAACFATAGVLTVKNFVTGLNGEALARQKVMRGPDGWTEWCQKNAKQYDGSVSRCYSENSGKINDDVKAMNALINADNAKIQNIEGGLKKSSGVFGDYVDGEAAKDKFVDQELSTYGDRKIKLSDGNEVYVKDLTKEVTDESGQKKRLLSYEEAKDLKLYLDLQQRASSDVSKELANSNLERIGASIYDRQRGTEAQSGLSTALGSSDLGKSVGVYGSRFSVAGEYTGGTLDDASFSKIEGVDVADKGKPAQLLTFDGKPYLVTLEQTQGDNYRIAKTYQLQGSGNGLSAVPVTSIPNAQFNTFKKVSRADCRNTIENPQVQFYETEPYKGLPAVVPFDTQEGWYVATRQTLPAFGSIKAFESSGKPVSFWVCNVGRDHQIDFFVSGFDDDVCQQFNLETGAALNKFSCLSESETKQVVDRAYRALQDAAQQRSQGAKSFVRIEGKSVAVGSPAVNVPGTQCQDFMDPDECKILFNVCDPVICPSSRCNFGGQYPVADVIQSGVIGSTLLCLPNAKEGIVVPVCLSGIKAGIDGYLSILKSYQQCLQESVDTGRSVGICDEISSVYLCEFFWRQAAPLANVLLPKLVELAYGQNQIHGGGEYLTVQSAWDNAQASVNYFTQSYAVNSLEAFNIRSIDDAGTQVCRAFISSKSSASFESLIEPDSPPQFHAWFSAIPYSDATVPATSQYKVFYHIFAGNDQGVSYTVYLKDPPQTSYYLTTQTIQVASGFVSKGQYATQTKDFTAPEGYKQLCVRINNKEECGFKEVTTDAGLDFIKDEVVSQQIKANDIKSERECVAGSVNPSAVFNVNPQEVAQEAIDPAIYNRGITRICATDNPGQHTDPRRFVDVGNCGDEKIRCWLDAQSVNTAITAEDKYVKNQTLTVITSELDQQFANDKRYVVGDAADKEILTLREKVRGTSDFSVTNGEKLVSEIDTLSLKVVSNDQKANLLFLKGTVYENICLASNLGKKPAIEANINPGTTNSGVNAPVQQGLHLERTYDARSTQQNYIFDGTVNTNVYLLNGKVMYNAIFIDDEIGRLVDGAITIFPSKKDRIDLALYNVLNGAKIDGQNVVLVSQEAKSEEVTKDDAERGQIESIKP
jgi:hypothetical protein